MKTKILETIKDKGECTDLELLEIGQDNAKEVLLAINSLLTDGKIEQVYPSVPGTMYTMTYRIK